MSNALLSPSDRLARVLGAALLLPLLAGAPAGAQSLVVNSAGDLPDRQPGDGVCFTGEPVGAEMECTFRAALEERNALGSSFPHAIEFSDSLFPTGDTHLVLRPATPYPAIRRPVWIRGETAKPYDPGAPFSRPFVTLLGTNLALGAGLFFDTGSNGSYVGGLAIAGFPEGGIVAGDTGGLVLQGNWVGIQGDGIVTGNRSQGIHVTSLATVVVIGGPSELVEGSSSHPGSGIGNVISGNDGIAVLAEGSDVWVLGNRIGTDPSGTSVQNTAGDHANTGWGIVLTGQRGLIGAEEVGPELLTEGRGNLVSGNGSGGIALTAESSSVPPPRVFANTVGTDASGTIDLGNAGHGIRVDADEAEIGGAALPGSDPRGNLVSGNDGAGVLVEGEDVIIVGNHVGVSRDGQEPLGNDGSGIQMVVANRALVASNVIAANGLDGIRASTQSSIFRLNTIGLSADGETALGNGDVGIQLGVAVNVDVEANTIGGNGSDGIRGTLNGTVIRSNRIGVSPSGADVGNAGDGVRILDFSLGWVGAVDLLPTGGLDPLEGNAIAFNDGAGIFATSLSTVGIRGNGLDSNGGLPLDLGFGSQGTPFYPVLISGDFDPGSQTASVTYLAPDFGFGGAGLLVDFYLAGAEGEEPATYLATDVIAATGTPGRTFVFSPPLGAGFQPGALVVAVAVKGEAGTDPLPSTEVSNAIPVPEPNSVLGLAVALPVLALLKARRRAPRRPVSRA